jgi:hypothetical protein
LQGFSATKCFRDSFRRRPRPLHRSVHPSGASAIGSRNAPRTHADDVPTAPAVTSNLTPGRPLAVLLPAPNHDFTPVAWYIQRFVNGRCAIRADSLNVAGSPRRAQMSGAHVWFMPAAAPC